ncbi:MAG TPA: tetratricopeptide repeat protein [Methylomirabilota bacterium]|nr:tetratricopeptide repeat protein [Methylomirabilota bacterium]
MNTLRMLAVCSTLLIPLAGCQTSPFGENSAFADDSDTLNDRESVNFHASDRPVAQGLAYFDAGHFGKAQSAFKRATEVTPGDGIAWLGLAASYDRLRRFDAADVAYRQAAKYVGSRPEYYNNVGYSYLLRGNLREARRFFLKAYELDPANPVTANNLTLLRSSIDAVQRG